MVELVTTLSGHQDSWAHRFVGCLSPMRHRYSKSGMISFSITVVNIMSVHHCPDFSRSLDAMDVVITLQ